MLSSKTNMLRIKHIFLVGIGGVGMSGIAEVLVNLGYSVSGSDIGKNPTIARLQSLGIKVFPKHEVKNVADVDVLVVSSAINKNNPELIAAKDNKIPVIPRAKMLSELMRFSKGIAVAGTHGKTTTTSLLASLLDQGGFEPTYVIGGRLNSLGANARLGRGKYFVAEADESDGSFLHLNPIISIVTNIDADHLETYNNDFSVLKATFIEFINKLPFYGLAVLCIDDPGIRSLLNKFDRTFLTYGFSKDADVYAFDWNQQEGISNFKVRIKGEAKKPLSISLNLPGKHNVLNSLAAIAVAIEVGVKPEQIQNTLNKFQGIGRRFQILGEYNLIESLSVSNQLNGDVNNQQKITLIDDYGHHPREIDAVIDAIRSGWLTRRLVMVYQLHRYSRTKALFDDFANVLSKTDVLVMLDVYPAGEAPIEGIDTVTMCKTISKDSDLMPIHVKDKTNLTGTLLSILKPGDILLMQGAGNISTLAHGVADNFNKITKVEPAKVY